jgi:hypothetical protein
VAIDDASRISYCEVLPDEKAVTAEGFLRRANEHYRTLGITTERVMTRQRELFRREAFRRGNARDRRPAHPHPALHAEDQR